MNEQSPFLRILTVYHRPAVLLDGPICTPIHVGRSLMDKSGLDDREKMWLLANMRGDDTGDNISAQNPVYRELTAHYWAWRNYGRLGNPEYVGLQHYRRQFLMNKEADADWYAIPREALDRDFIKQASFTEETARRALADHDGLFIQPRIEKERLYDKQRLHPVLNRWVETTRDILRESGREYLPHFLAYLDGVGYFPFNMFVLSRSLFFRYSAWIFPLLAEMEKRMAAENTWYNAGYLGEILLGVFKARLEEEGRRFRLVKNSFILNSGDSGFATPIPDSLPVAFNIEDNAVPYLLVSLKALRDNLPAGRKLDILLLDNGVSAAGRHAVLALRGDDTSISFIDSGWLLPELNDLYFHGHEAVQLLKKMALPEALRHYDRILLLGSDTLATGDVSRLFTIAPADCSAAAGVNASGEVDFAAVLMNLSAMRRNGFCQRLRTALGEKTDVDAETVATVAGRLLREDGLMRLDETLFAQACRADSLTPPPILIGHDGRAWNRAAKDFSRHFLALAPSSPMWERIAARLPRTAAAELGGAAAPPSDGFFELLPRRRLSLLRNSMSGQTVVILGTDPSVASYRPIAGAIHVGVNLARRPDGVALDYIVAASEFADGNPAHLPRVEALAGRGKQVFMALLWRGYDTIEINALAERAERAGVGLFWQRSKYADPSRPEFALDILAEPLDRGSYVVDAFLFAVQIALYAGAERIVLACCGESDLDRMYGSGLPAARLRADWLELRDFAKRWYPSVAITTVTSPRLAGIFSDAE